MTVKQNLIDNNKIPIQVFEVLRTLQNKGYQAYLVGGACRDLILNRQVKDWDITTSALPEDVINLFRHTIPTGIKHGTVTVIMDNLHIEVTTFRIDGDYSDNRKPDNVIFTNNAEEDVKRRDFTINGLLYDGEKIIDYVHGLFDLHYKIIRCIGNPKDRFEEDSLRVMRAIRFACQLGFEIEGYTKQQIEFSAYLINLISKERIRDELIKILISNHPSEGIRLLKETQILYNILPELQKCVGFDQTNYHHDKDVFEHILEVLSHTPCNLKVRLSALFHDIGKPDTFSIDKENIGHFYLHHVKGAEITEQILIRLKFDNETIRNVKILVREHMTRYQKIRKVTVKKLIIRVGLDNIDDLINLQIADIIGTKPPYNFDMIYSFKKEAQRILTEKEPLSLKSLAINGNDVMRLGIEQGKKVGEVLNYLLEIILENPELNNKEELLKIVYEKEF